MSLHHQSNMGMDMNHTSNGDNNKSDDEIRGVTYHSIMVNNANGINHGVMSHETGLHSHSHHPYTSVTTTTNYNYNINNNQRNMANNNNNNNNNNNTLSLLETAELAYKLTKPDWSNLGRSTTSPSSSRTSFFSSYSSSINNNNDNESLSKLNHSNLSKQWCQQSSTGHHDQQCDEAKYSGEYMNININNNTTNTIEFQTSSSSTSSSSSSKSTTNSTPTVKNTSPPPTFGIDKIHIYTENILSLLLIRIIAILQIRNDAPNLPTFKDLSTTTICRTIMADEARRGSDDELRKEMEPLTWPDIITEEVICQLRCYVHKTLRMYRRVCYHNCEHAHHVFISANKLLDLMLCEYNWTSLDEEEEEDDEEPAQSEQSEEVEEEELQEQGQAQEQHESPLYSTSAHAPTVSRQSTPGTVESTTTCPSVSDGKKSDPNPFFQEDDEEESEESEKEESAGTRINDFGLQELTFSLEDLKMMDPSPKRIKRPTYGMKNDPLIHLGFLFSALVHDVDHKGITNRQLVLESDELAIMYNDQSVAEQRSLAVAFTLLMQDEYIDLRKILFIGRHEFLRFRSNVIGLVLCTDISSPERVQIGKSKWKEAFGEKKKEKHTNSHRQNSNGSNHNHRRGSNHTNDSDDNEDPERKKSELARISKERNAWKSNPADPTLAEPKNKNNLVRQFYSGRGSMTPRSKSMNHDSIHGGNYASFSDNDEHSVSSDRSDDDSAYSTCMESEGELNSYSFKKFSQSTKRAGSDPKTCGLSSHTNSASSFSGSSSPPQRNGSTVEIMKLAGSRRFSEPHYIMSRKRRFHFRLGIRRALDLTGTTIEAYDKKCCEKNKNGRVSDPDRPNCLKAVVVLEQMLRAADIAAVMQQWNTMIKWSRNLFLELKTSFVQGRGDDPAYGWHENQIAFFESYALPLAKNLVETGVLEEDESRNLVRNVQENNVRWMIEGRKHVQKLMQEWDAKQPKRRSAPNIYGIDLCRDNL